MTITAIISGFALAVSLAVAVFTLSARAVPLLWCHTLSRKEQGGWQVKGDLLYVSNVGRRPMLIDGVGIVNEQGGLFHRDSVEFLDEVVENPALPVVLQPGEIVTFRFTPEVEYPKPRYGIDWIRRGMRGRPSRKRVVFRTAKKASR